MPLQSLKEEKARITKRKLKPGSYAVRIVLLSALVVALWDFFQNQNLAFHPSYVNFAGLCLSVMGIYMRLVAVRTLGKRFTAELKIVQNHELVKHGVYKYIRHPAYLGTSILGIGISLIFSSLYSFLLMLALLPCYLYRIHCEEVMLLEEFGDEYREYMKKTKKIIPFIY